MATRDASQASSRSTSTPRRLLCLQYVRRLYCLIIIHSFNNCTCFPLLSGPLASLSARTTDTISADDLGERTSSSSRSRRRRRTRDHAYRFREDQLPDSLPGRHLCGLERQLVVPRRGSPKIRKNPAMIVICPTKALQMDMVRRISLWFLCSLAQRSPSWGSSRRRGSRRS